MAAPVFDDPPILITQTHDLDDLVSELITFPKVAIDTESDSFYRYDRRICLVQITAGGVDYIIDPLDGGDLTPLTRLLTHTDVEKVFHGGENDLTLFLDTLGVRVAGPYFDTYIAAQIAGEKKVGFGALVGAHFGFKLDKKFQLHDWGQRPLSPEAIAYARGDTHFLLPLREKVWGGVTSRNREHHANEEFERLLDKVSPSAPFDPDSCLRLKGIRGLRGNGLKVLRQLYVMRDEVAKKKDLAPFRILSNKHLVELSHSRPRSLDALKNLPLYRDRGVQRYARLIISAVEAGLHPEAPEPTSPPRGSGPPSPELDARVKALKAWRNKACQRLDLSPGLMASNAVLTAIAEALPSDTETLSAIPEVRQWQVDEFGERWLSILAEGP